MVGDSQGQTSDEVDGAIQGFGQENIDDPAA